jgi:hypothetical protein
LVGFGEEVVTLELLTCKEYPARFCGAGKMKHILSLRFSFGTMKNISKEIALLAYDCLY